MWRWAETHPRISSFLVVVIAPACVSAAALTLLGALLGGVR